MTDSVDQTLSISMNSTLDEVFRLMKAMGSGITTLKFTRDDDESVIAIAAFAIREDAQELAVLVEKFEAERN